MVAKSPESPYDYVKRRMAAEKKGTWKPGSILESEEQQPYKPLETKSENITEENENQDSPPGSSQVLQQSSAKPVGLIKPEQTRAIPEIKQARLAPQRFGKDFDDLISVKPSTTIPAKKPSTDREKQVPERVVPKAQIPASASPLLSNVVVSPTLPPSDEEVELSIERLKQRKGRTSPKWVGVKFLELFDACRTEAAKGKSTQELAFDLTAPGYVIGKLRYLPDFSTRMREIIAKYNLSPYIASDIYRFPATLWERLTRARVTHRLGAVDFAVVLYRHRKNAGTLRQLLAKRGFTDWPKDVDDEGNPKQE